MSTNKLNCFLVTQEEYTAALNSSTDFSEHESNCGKYGIDWTFISAGYCDYGIFCNVCGWVAPGFKNLREEAEPVWITKRDTSVRKRTRVSKETKQAYRSAGVRFGRGGGIIGLGVCRNRGRYKPKFHCNERISQFCMQDPAVPYAAWQRILAESQNAKYGPSSLFTRATIITMLKNIRMSKYRERWKSILHKLNPDSPCTFPPPQLIEYLILNFNRVLDAFIDLKHTMPKSYTKDKLTNKLTAKERHNLISYNYIFRKLLETVEGTEEWQEEFPVPTSDRILLALDNVMELICRRLGLRFSRSLIMRRPKFKRSKKERQMQKLKRKVNALELKLERLQLKYDASDSTPFLFEESNPMFHELQNLRVEYETLRESIDDQQQQNITINT